jgi:hypothetical protein
MLAADLGRPLVAELAPEELPLFDQTWRALGRHPERRGRRREEPLGFGLPEAGEVLVTAMVSGVVMTVLQDLGKSLESTSARALAALRRQPGRAVPDRLLPLSAEPWPDWSLALAQTVEAALLVAFAVTAGVRATAWAAGRVPARPLIIRRSRCRAAAGAHRRR